MRSGTGGAGAVSFRREKHVALGGPDGGDGGRGGDVIIQADGRLATLLDLRYKRRQHAKNGRPGEGRDKSGASAQNLIIRVPVGTQIFDAESEVLVADLTIAGESIVVATGGRGGRGNASYANASRRAPDFAQAGQNYKDCDLKFVLKLLADVGLVGFPNAGKSTFVSRVSKARPKIADYPFTTLKPNLGVVRVDDERSYVVADIPGIIEGAADGAGLGLQFLRHIERTELFLFLVTLDYGEDRSPLDDFKKLRAELGAYDIDLLTRPYIVVLSQCDRPDVLELLESLQAALGESVPVLPISSVTGLGVRPLLNRIAQTLEHAGRWEE